MRKTVLSLTIGMAAVCALTMLTVVNAAEKMDMEQFGDLNLDITEDVSDSNVLDDLDLSLPAPEAPKAEQKAETAPVKELNIAQNPTPANAVPAVVPEEAPMDAENVSNVLAEPALDAPNEEPITNAAPANAEDVLAKVNDVLAPAKAEEAPAKAEEAPAKAEEAPAKAEEAVPVKEDVAEPVIQQLPPVEKSIVNPTEKVITESVTPVVTIDPTMKMAVPANPNMGGTPMMVERSRIRARGNCPSCPPVEYDVYGTRRPIHYGIQRNGYAAYPTAGSGCPHHRPMEYPYYTLRGPRDFDDPNPRPIGP